MRSVSLARAMDIQNVEFDPSTHSWSAITLRPGCLFLTVPCGEQLSRFEEKAVREPGGTLVSHSLVLFLSGMDAAGARCADDLAQCPGGVVAIVETLAGERLLAGYSRRMGTECALRLTEALSDTGTLRPDTPRRRIILQAFDGDHALPFTGSLL